MQEMLNNQQIHHEKEMGILQAKLSKTDAQLHVVIKDKNYAISQTLAKDKQLLEIQKSQITLKNKLEKQEKVVNAYHEKHASVQALQRKIEEYEKQQGKQKVLAEKKTVHENEALVGQVKHLNSKFEALNAENEKLQSALSIVKSERKDLAKKLNAASGQVQSLKEKLRNQESEWNEEKNELVKRSKQLAETVASQKHEFTMEVQNIKNSFAAEKDEFQRANWSFEKQKDAYLTRINQLECDLERMELSVAEKDAQINDVTLQISAIHANRQAEHQKTQRVLEQASVDSVSLRDKLKEKEKHLSGIEEKLAHLLTDKDESDAQHKQDIKHLQAEVSKYKAKCHEYAQRKDKAVNDKETIVASQQSEISTLKQTLRDVEANLQQAQSKVDALANENEELAHQVTQKEQEYSAKLQDVVREMDQNQKNTMEQSASYSQLLKEYQEAIQTLNRERLENSSKQADALATIQSHKDGYESQIAELNRALVNAKSNLSDNLKALQEELAITRDKLSETFEEKETLEVQNDAVVAQYEAKIRTLESTIKSLEAESSTQVKDLLQQTQKLSAENDELERSVSILKTKIASDQLKFDSSTKTFKTQLDKLTKEKSLVDDKLAQAGNSCKELRDLLVCEKSLLEQKISNAQLEVLEKVEEIQRLESRLEEMESVNTSLSLEADNLGKKLQQEAKRHQLELSVAQKNFEDVEAAIAKLKMEHDAEQEAIHKLESEILVKEVRINELELSRFEYDEERKRATMRMTILEDKLDMAECEAEQLRSLVADLQILNDSHNAHASFLESSLEKQQADNWMLLGSVSKSENMLRTTQYLVDDQLAEISRLSQTNMSILADNIRFGDISARLRLELVESHIEQSGVESELAEKDASIAYLRTSLLVSSSKLASVFNDLGSTSAQLAEELRDAQSNLVSLQEQLALKELALKRQTVESETQRVTLTKQNEKLSDSLAHASSDLDIANQMLEEKSKLVADLSQKNNALQIELQEAVDTWKRYEGIILGLEEQLDASADQVQELQNIQDEMQSNLDKAYQDLNDADSQLQQTRVELETARSQVENLHEDLQNKSWLLENAEKRALELEEDVAGHVSTVEKLQGQVQAQTDELANLNNQLMSEKSQVESIRSNAEYIKTKLDEKSELLIKQKQEFELEMNASKNQISALDVEISRKEAELQETSDSMQAQKTELSDELEQANLSLLAVKNELEREKSNCVSLLEAIKLKDAEIEEHRVATTQELEALALNHSAEVQSLKETHSKQVADFQKERKQHQEAQLQLIKETQVMSGSIQEASRKADELHLHLEAKNKQIQSITSKLQHAESELESLRAASKKEFAEQSIRYSALESRLTKESSEFERVVQDITVRLAEKSNDLKQAQLENHDFKSRIGMVELKFTNELSAKDLKITSLESKVREQLRVIEKLELRIKQISSNAGEKTDAVKILEAQIQTLKESEKRLQASIVSRNEEHKKTHQRIADAEALVQKLKILLDEAHKNERDLKENFESQLQILNIRGKVDEDEMKKIGELNAELFGHSNSRQKIKHVAHMKEENVSLKKVYLVTKDNMILTRQRDELKRKVVDLETEVEAFRSIGTVRKLFKATRMMTPFKDQNKTPNQSRTPQNQTQNQMNTPSKPHTSDVAINKQMAEIDIPDDSMEKENSAISFAA